MLKIGNGNSSFKCVYTLLYRQAACSNKLNVTHAEEISNCYSILRLEEGSNAEHIRESYLQLAKEYHPDSRSKNANSQAFGQIDQAYRMLLEYHQNANKVKERFESLIEEAEEEPLFDKQHTAAQHRQYLEHEGIGFGPPSVRQKQYQLHKVNRAAENVTDYRTSKISAQYETSLVTQNRKKAKKIIIRNTIERLAEDLISSSIANGEFDNLPGKGKPLKDKSFNPMIDATDHNINKILIDNGYVPNWILLKNEIRQDMIDARDTLLKTRLHCGGEDHLPTHMQHVWKHAEAKLEDTIQNVNRKINNYNLQAPSLLQQMVHYNAQRECRKF